MEPRVLTEGRPEFTNRLLGVPHGAIGIALDFQR
jgi:hypothetical protein